MNIYEAKTTYRKIGEVVGACTDTIPDVVNYMRGAFREFPLQEQLWILSIDANNKIRSRERVAVGTATRVPFDMALVFRPVLLQGACSFAVVHNHPDGDPTPSPEDVKASKRIEKAAKVMDIIYHDFLIIGEPCNRYYSFNEQGLVG